MPENETVAIGGSFGGALVAGDPEDWAKWGYAEDEDGIDKERAQALQDDFFEKYDFLGNEFPGDPEEHYYQGMTFTSVIRRKSDGKRFGYNYWKPISKYGEFYVEPNGYEHGYEDQEVWVFQEVRPFSVVGFEVIGFEA